MRLTRSALFVTRAQNEVFSSGICLVNFCTKTSVFIAQTKNVLLQIVRVSNLGGNNMQQMLTPKERLLEFTAKNKFFRASDAETKAQVSHVYLQRFVESGKLVKTARGLYLCFMR